MHVSSLEYLDFFTKKTLGTFPQSKELYAVYFFLQHFMNFVKIINICTTAILLHEFALKYYYHICMLP